MYMERRSSQRLVDNIVFTYVDWGAVTGYTLDIVTHIYIHTHESKG